MYPTTQTLKFTGAGKALLGVTALTTLGFVIGCMRAYSNQPNSSQSVPSPDTANTAESNNPSKPAGILAELQHTLDSIPKKQVTLKGAFTQGLEQSVFDDGTTKYHVFDPNNLLSAYAKAQGQTGVSVSLPICI